MLAIYGVIILLVSFLWALWSAKKKFGNFEKKPIVRHHLPRHAVLFNKKK